MTPSWQRLPLKRALRPGGGASLLIKGEVADEQSKGLVPGFSASGQDVWLDEAQFFGPGLVLSAVGARCGKVFEASGHWGVVANTVVLLPQPGHDPHYLWYLVNNESFWEKGGTAQPYVRVSDTLDRRLSFPSQRQQRAIADYLDAETARIDALIAKKRRMIDLIHERLDGAIFSEATGVGYGSRRPSSLDWVSEVPSHWRVVPLRYFADLGSGHTPSRSVEEYWTDCTIPWISLFDVGTMRNPFNEVTSETAQAISELGMANSSARLHPAETVVLSRTASVGFSTIMGVPMAVSQHFVTWTCGAELLPRFLLYVLRAMRQKWSSLQVGTTNVTVFMPDLFEVKVPLPPVSEQQDIVRKISESIDASKDLVRSLERQVGLLVEHRQGLITAAVTGELEVPGVAA